MLLKFNSTHSVLLIYYLILHLLMLFLSHYYFFFHLPILLHQRQTVWCIMHQFCQDISIIFCFIFMIHFLFIYSFIYFLYNFFIILFLFYFFISFFYFNTNIFWNGFQYSSSLEIIYWNMANLSASFWNFNLLSQIKSYFRR